MSDQRFLVPCVLLVSFCLFCGCGGGGSDSSPTAANTTETISGSVTAPSGVLLSVKSGGILPATGLEAKSGVSITLYKIDDNGTKSGSTLSTAVTDSSGNYSIALPEGVSFASNLVVAVGSGNNLMRAFVTGTKIDLNPLTELVVSKVAENSQSLSQFTITEIASILDQVNTSGASVSLSGQTTVVSTVASLYTGTVKTTLDTAVVSAGGSQTPASNQSPIASAGASLTVSIGDNVVLTAAGSSDPDGNTLSYSWTQSSGVTVTLTGANTATPSFSPGEAASYSFLVTVSDGSLSASATTTVTATPIQNGSYVVDIFYKDLVSSGTTLFYDTAVSSNPRLVEISMKGETVWEYAIPASYRQKSTIGQDVDKLSNGNYLFLTGTGIYEVTASGTLVWSYAETKLSHDIQRLPNGDTMYVFGNDDTFNDTQVKRVNSSGTVVWSWAAKNFIASDGVSDQGWTHTNAVIWESNDDILYINLRNQYKTLKIASSGNILWEMDWKSYGTDVDPHEPDILDNGNILICLQNDAQYVAVELNPSTKQSVWTYANASLRTTRDADRLANGNTLLVAVNNGGTTTDFSDDYSTFLEVTTAGKIVWRLTLKVPVDKSPGFFYKAQRITSPYIPKTTQD